MKIHTIGFTKKSAEQFFEKIRRAGVKRVVDTRLHNTSQLAGFAKGEDLRYFLREMQVAEYSQEPLLAPSDEILDAFKKGRMNWSEYENCYRELIANRRVEERLDPTRMDDACLLCSEDKPHHCHRRLAAEYLRDHWPDVQINHIV